MIRRHTPRGRLLITGTVLLLLLGIGVLITGQIINRMAAAQSDRIIIQIGEYHCHILQTEFRQSEEILRVSSHFVSTHTSPSEAELNALASALLEMDPKAGRIWFLDPDSGSARDFPREGAPAMDRATDFRTAIIGELSRDSLWSRVVHSGSVPVWSIARLTVNAAGRKCICGVDISLPLLYVHMAGQNPFSRSYAALFDPSGIIVYHPDSLKVGLPATDSMGRTAFRAVITSGERSISDSLSDYLQIEEKRIYSPIVIGGKRWVAGIGIPKLAIEQEIGDFHFYTILTALISLAFFGVLLFLAQRRWRKEYELRRLSERESEQLHLQQLIEQIDPHFLFNSLNSLYALIRCNPEQAREFTLTLSRVYRHVLERRHNILSTVADELDFTWQYCSLQKIRFGDRLELTSAVDPALLSRRIPSMSLQTLVENAVKHNRITAHNPLRISIRTEQGRLVIENNYSPRSDSHTESLRVGLERIRSVYRFYTTENISISITSDQGIFRCSLPLLAAEKPEKKSV